MTENKKQFKTVEDYLVSYDGDYFDLHKPSDIRSLVTVVNYVVDENEQLKKENNELKEQNENLLAKLKFVCDKINYSERLREMMK